MNISKFDEVIGFEDIGYVMNHLFADAQHEHQNVLRMNIVYL